jgi:hypothetical protein
MVPVLSHILEKEVVGFLVDLVLNGQPITERLIRHFKLAQELYQYSA